MSGEGVLQTYFLRNGDLQINKWLHYFDIYEKHFERLRDRPITMLEIGVFGGGSLQMWRDYFHPESRIVGIDIKPECAEYASDRIDVHIGSQDDEEFLLGLSEKYGGFDIVLDDGSHLNAHVIKSFETLYHKVASDGIYMIEDTHTSYWPGYGGGLRKEGTSVEFAKKLVDDLTAAHARNPAEFPVTDITRTTTSISFYDSIIVFEKAPQGKRQHIRTEPMP